MSSGCLSILPILVNVFGAFLQIWYKRSLGLTGELI